MKYWNFTTHTIFLQNLYYIMSIYIFNVCFIPLFITLKVQQRENIRLKIYYINLLKHIKTIQILWINFSGGKNDKTFIKNVFIYTFLFYNFLFFFWFCIRHQNLYIQIIHFINRLNNDVANVIQHCLREHNYVKVLNNVPISLKIEFLKIN